MKEGRLAGPDFNVRTYMAAYEDLRNAFGGDWEKYFRHYLDYGMAEKRRGI